MSFLLFLAIAGVSQALIVPLVPHHVQARRLNSIASLYQGFGTHYVDLWCGFPTPQRQTVIVDTGSGVTAFPCSGCVDCGASKYHTDSLFDEKQSETFAALTCDKCQEGHCENNECTLGMAYAEGSSWSAVEVKDLCYIGGPHDQAVGAQTEQSGPFDPQNVIKFNLTFGCQHRLTGLFKTQLADGILGMDRAASSYWNQLLDSGVHDSPNFGLCFARYNHIERNGTEAGGLTLGPVETSWHTSEMRYADMSASEDYYGVSIRRLYLVSDPVESMENVQIGQLRALGLETEHTSVIIDSGTTDSYFPSQWAQEFYSMWKSITNEDYNTKNEYDELPQHFPTLIVQLVGVENGNSAINLDPSNQRDVWIAVPPSHYLEFSLKKQKWRPRLYFTEGPNSGLLGANVLMGHDTYFDQIEERLGWAESHCKYTPSNEDDTTWASPAAIETTTSAQGSSTESPQTTTITDPPQPASTVPDEGHQIGPSAAVVTDPPQPFPDATHQDVTEFTDDDDDDDEGDLPATETGSNTSGFVRQEEDTFCNTLSCQLSLVGVALLAVVIITMVALRRNSSEYKLEELNTEDEDEFGFAGSGYSDEPQSIELT